MQKSLLVLLGSFLLCLCVQAQIDTALTKRLQEFMRVNEKLELEKVLDYTYPKLFTIVPRDKMEEALRSSFDNEELKIRLDSLRVDTIFPVFTMENASFAKLKYSMNMLMHFKEDAGDSLSEEDRNERNEFMITQLESDYGNGNITVDATGALKIKIRSMMVAIRDSYARQWSFVNLEEKEPLMNRLFSKAVRDKLATYK